MKPVHFLIKKNNQKQTMGTLFHKWLLIFTMSAFAAAFFSSYYLNTLQAETVARRSLSSEITYVDGQVDDYKSKETEQRQFAKDALLSKAFSVAKIIKGQPDVLNNSKILSDIAVLFTLDGIFVTDETGMIVKSIPAEYEYKFSFNNQDTTKKYMGLINGTVDSIAEEPRLNDTDKANGIENRQQYAGVPRLDKKGIIQIAYSSEQYNKTMSSVSIENFATGYRFSNTGSLFIMSKSRNSKIVSSSTGKDVGKSMKEAGVSAFVPSKKYMDYAEVIYNNKKCMGAFDTHAGFFIMTILPYSEVYSNRNKVMIWTAMFYFILFAAVYAMISNLLNQVVIKGFDETNKVLTDIVNGNLNGKVRVDTTQEFVSLSNGINSTVEALNKAITEAAHRLDKELEFARAIQYSAVPNMFPPFPEHREFDIFASMRTAKEVGGDFYDFFLVENNKLGFVIADVSGKGIPAALFMMTAKTHLKNYMSSGRSLKDAVEAANNSLCENNEAEMFVTAFAGILNYTTGELRFVNCGHNSPLLRHNGTYEWMRQKSGLMLGIMSGMPYKEYTLNLTHGDLLYLYTDGVTEAMNAEGKLYGDETLIKYLNNHSRLGVSEILYSVLSSVDYYADGAPQADDITMLALEYGKTTEKELAKMFPAGINQLEPITDFINTELDECRCPDKIRNEIDVCIEELYVNIVNYSGAQIVDIVTKHYISPAGICISIIDSGVPFDPVKHSDPKKVEKIEDAKVGGLGIEMVRKMTDVFMYRREDDKNKTTICRFW